MKWNYSPENDEKIKEFETRINKLENKTQNTETNALKSILVKLELSEKVCENKMKTFEKQLETFKDVIGQKDEKISSLEEQVKEMENKLKELKKNEDKVKKPKKKKQCPHCEFEASSERGLRTHITRIHTDSKNIEFPTTCELCDFVAKNKSELKSYLKTHSYKSVNFKCKECEQFCETEIEMEVHIGKKHSDQFDCGICGFEIKTLEDLNIHLTTCEMYKCEECDLRVKSLSEIKKHVENEHSKWKKLQAIIHIKQNRNDSEVVDEISYRSGTLFPEFLKD